MVAFNQLIDVGLAKLYHELFSKLKIECNDFENERLLFVSHDTDDIVFAIDYLTGLAEKTEAL